METWQLVAGFGVCLLIFWWVKLRGSAQYGGAHSAIFLILHDGRGTQVQKAKMDDAGNIVARGITYPAGVPVQVINECGLNAAFFLMAAEPLALAEHRTLEVARRHIVMGSIFKAGGQLYEMVRIGAACLVIVVGLYSFMQASELAGQLAQQSAEIAKLSEILSKPLVAVPPAD